MKTTTKAESDRFQTGASEYARYLETPEGRLRSDLTFANLTDFLPSSANGTLRALDLGGGTGAAAIRLARLGIDVTLLDSSQAMLDIAKNAIHKEGVADKVVLQHGDVVQVTNLFPARSFDVVLCHNLLEYCDDPGTVLRGAAGALRNSSATLSVLVRAQAGEVLKAAINSGDLDAAKNALTEEWGHESLYGGRVRLFTAESLRTLLAAARLAPVAERGVRVLSDYLPSKISPGADYQRIFDLERQLGRRPEFAAIARYSHYLARHSTPIAESK